VKQRSRLSVLHTNDNVTGRAWCYTSPIMHWNTKTGRKALARTQPRKVLLFCKVQGAIVVITVVTIEPLTPISSHSTPSRNHSTPSRNYSTHSSNHSSPSGYHSTQYPLVFLLSLNQCNISKFQFNMDAEDLHENHQWLIFLNTMN